MSKTKALKIDVIVFIFLIINPYIDRLSFYQLTCWSSADGYCQKLSKISGIAGRKTSCLFVIQHFKEIARMNHRNQLLILLHLDFELPADCLLTKHCGFVRIPE